MEIAASAAVALASFVAPPRLAPAPDQLLTARVLARIRSVEEARKLSPFVVACGIALP